MTRTYASERVLRLGLNDGRQLSCLDAAHHPAPAAPRRARKLPVANSTRNAVVREFQAKLAKAERQADDGVPGRDSVIELEQAGDSAKAAADADAGLSSDARESVLAAHLAICKLKAGA